MALRHPKPTAEQNAGRLVRRAAQILEDRGWIQGDVGDGQRGMCARGAIIFAARGTTNTEAIDNQVWLTEREFTRWLAGTEVGSESTAWRAVPMWNDTPGRTKEEVVQYMRKFADEVDPRLK
jgi:hypothetical protein